MSEHYAASFLAGELLELIPTIGTDAAKTWGMLWVALVLVNQVVTGFNRSLSGNDNAEIGSVRIPSAYSVSHGLHGEGNFRNKNSVRAAGDALVQRNSYGISAQHFQDHDSIMH